MVAKASEARMKLCIILLSITFAAQAAVISHLRLKEPDYFDYQEEEPSTLPTVYSNEINRVAKLLKNIWRDLNSKLKVGGKKCVETLGSGGGNLCLPLGRISTKGKKFKSDVGQYPF